jgi:hypothetical protein
MSSLVFECVGAATAKQLFSNMSTESLGHGYLFTGAAGIGKKTFARRLAQSILCAEKTPMFGYCKTCASCRMFASKTHPDYTEAIGEIKIGKAGEKSGEEITARGIVKQLALHAYHGSHRIVVLGDAAFATEESANALLKFFEEPPAGVVIILTTSAPGGLLTTIQSRLVEIPFERLDTQTIVTILEADGVTPTLAREAAEGAMGSVTAARAILVVGAVNIRSIAFGWFANALAGKSADLRLEALRIIARDYAVSIVAGPRAPKLATELAAKISGLPKRGPREATAILDSVHETIKLAQTNVSAALVADYLRVALAPATQR